ncbi:glycoside hydrolase family 27 protein [Cellulomonas shaoxiangyii]|uniref:Alpha-galactosidase n=1 Tax=Cellulomonas shaoxiangyii TaxID=2566013 RepID=A0A4P7SF77_9CELL|nr:glycoside hydrolase family 27 protein [Cellulomonas shaoxiangyii]QCB92829.1 glycoside hydrolase family 27 protein [Cellulomonas shaoxiangyii]TGY85524.1 glycoside hydrolase family 27 protein [Cellulomonas shaoxiangyii]
MALAHTPPMGWNSWDCYGTTVTEAEVLANARFLAEHMAPHGWDTVVVDIDWSDPDARPHGYVEDAALVLDAHGYPQPAPGRFPSATDGRGFTALAAEVHALGLRFGVHVLRGVPRRAVAAALPVPGDEGWTTADVADPTSTCAWNGHMVGLDHTHPGAQAWLDGLVAQLASWGVDFVKVDDMLAPFHADAVAAWSTAIARSGRDMVLSLSPGTRLSTEHLPLLREHAQMWRVCDDLWDRWEDVHANFSRLARWAPHQRPGGWADADMLPLGRIGIRAERGEDRSSRLTLDEQRTLLTLWVMARSPLMMGGDLPTSDPATIALLTTPAVGHVLRTGVDGRELLREPVGDGSDAGELVVWAARAGDGTDGRYVAVFWTGDRPRTERLPLSSLLGDDDAARGPWSVRDLWAGDDLPAPAGTTAEPRGVLELEVPAHGVRWVELHRQD